MGREIFTATLLGDGMVLATGGDTGPQGLILASSERFDPTLESWTGAGNLQDGRFLHTATMLADGSVLVAGGSRGFGGSALSSAEIYAP